MVVDPPRRGPNVKEMGMFVVTAPKVRDFQKHDKVQILINESSIQKFEQKQDNKENYDLKAELKQFPSIMELLRNATLRNGIGSPTPSAGAAGAARTRARGPTSGRTLHGQDLRDGHGRQANGMMLVEARETIQSDKEVKTMVVSGLVDPKDVTNVNSVFSTQMADLVIKVEHTGEVRTRRPRGGCRGCLIRPSGTDEGWHGLRVMTTGYARRQEAAQ